MIQADDPGLARALGDPRRVGILVRLLEGPATVAALTELTSTNQPNLSNHLAVLRAAGLVAGERTGRQIRYRLADPQVAQLVEAFVSVSGSSTPKPAPGTPLAEARTCYDHLAGRLGVALFDALVWRRAISAPDANGVVALDDGAEEVFGSTEIDVGRAAAQRRRRFAYGCLDWTERRMHLGGALGAEMCRRFVDAGWVLPQEGTRAVLLTARGRRVLRRFGVASPYP
jgi:DNA-binding transcriptional ArsR family regulator